MPHIDANHLDEYYDMHSDQSHNDPHVDSMPHIDQSHSDITHRDVHEDRALL